MNDIEQMIVDSASDAMALYLFRPDLTTAYEELQSDVAAELSKVLPTDVTFTVRCDQSTNPPDYVIEGLLCAIVAYSRGASKGEVRVMVRLPRGR